MRFLILVSVCMLLVTSVFTAQADLFVGCANSATNSLLSSTGGGLVDSITNMYRSVVGVEVDPFNNYVYMGGGNYHTVVRANYDGTGLTRINTGTSTNYSDGTAPFGERLDFALDVTGNRLFITTGGAGQQVCSGNLDGTGGTTVLWDMNERLNGIEYDWVHDKIYFISLDSGLYVANADGSGSPSLLFPGTEFRQLTLDPYAEKIYWTDWSGNQILGGSMSGGTASAVFSGLANRPYGIDLDNSGTLYWSEVFNHEIYSGSTNGTGKVLLGSVYDGRGVATLSPIPEPSTIVLLGIGLTVVFRRVKRQTDPRIMR